MRNLRVRLLIAQEKAKYQELMERYHYIGALRSNLGKALQYVAEDSETGEWYGLLDWGYGSLKNPSRESWLGWDRELKDRRLKYIVTNTRFLILPGMPRHRNLASQILSKNVKRLSADWARYHGHHLLLAETFVDISRFAGTCYKAANWLEIGLTKGFGRSNKKYIEHKETKKVLVYPLYPKAREILSSKQFPNKLLMPEFPLMNNIDLNRLPLLGKDSLFEVLSKVEDPRQKKGIRYKLESILALTLCAVLTGIDGFRGIHEFGRALPLEMRMKLRFRKGITPDEETIRILLNQVDARNFDRLVSDWLSRNVPKYKGRAIAIDGKTMRATRKEDGSQSHILSAVLHNDGITLGSIEVPAKSNEIPSVPELLEPLDVRGDLITLDAMHTQRNTAEFIVKDKHAHYLMTVKENQGDLLRKLERLPDESFSPSLHNK
jgi:hypothetical protein